MIAVFEMTVSSDGSEPQPHNTYTLNLYKQQQTEIHTENKE